MWKQVVTLWCLPRGGVVKQPRSGRVSVLEYGFQITGWDQKHSMVDLA